MPSQHRPILLAILPFFALTIAFGLLSDGVHHDDDLTHYLMARWSGWYPSYLLHVWGRPGLTVPLAAVAWIGDRETGWHAARILSAVVTAASALLAARMAHRLNVRPPWLVVAVCYLQPLAALLGFTTLTENFTAFYLIAAIALFQANRPLVASIVFSLVLVTRHETAVFLPIWLIALCGQSIPWSRRGIAAALSIWAPVVHNVLFYSVFGAWPLRIFSQAGGSTEYTAQSIWSYIPDALYAVPPAIAGFALLGAIAMLRHRQWLIPAVAVTFFATQVAIKWLGVYGSGGYGRFMVVVAPFIAILAVAGITDAATRLRERRPIGLSSLLFASVWLVGLLAFEEQRLERNQVWSSQSLWLIRGTVGAIFALLLVHGAIVRRGAHRFSTRAVAAILLVTCLIQCACIVRPLCLRPRDKLVQRTVNWLEQKSSIDSPFFATNPWFAYFLDLAEDPRAHKDAALLASMPVGTIFVWDSIYGGSDFHQLDAAVFDRDSHYELLNILRLNEETSMTLRVYRKTSPTPLPTTRPNYYPPVPEDQEPVLGIYYTRMRRR